MLCELTQVTFALWVTWEGLPLVDSAADPPGASTQNHAPCSRTSWYSIKNFERHLSLTRLMVPIPSRMVILMMSGLVREMGHHLWPDPAA